MCVFDEIDESFVIEQLSCLDSSKATSHDGISSKLLKLLASYIVSPLTYIINLCLSTCSFPSSDVSPVHKGGDPKKLNRLSLFYRFCRKF